MAEKKLSEIREIAEGVRKQSEKYGFPTMPKKKNKKKTANK